MSKESLSLNVVAAAAAAAAGIPICSSPIKVHSARHAADHFRWAGWPGRAGPAGLRSSDREK